MAPSQVHPLLQTLAGFMDNPLTTPEARRYITQHIRDNDLSDLRQTLVTSYPDMPASLRESLQGPLPTQKQIEEWLGGEWGRRYLAHLDADTDTGHPLMRRVHSFGFGAALRHRIFGRTCRIARMVDYVHIPGRQMEEKPPRAGTFFVTISAVGVVMEAIQKGRRCVVARKPWTRVHNAQMDQILAGLADLAGNPVVTDTFLDCDDMIWRHQRDRESENVTVHRPEDEFIVCEMTLI